MNEDEALLYIRSHLKKADEEMLKRIICSINGPRCSANCPLRDKSSSECKRIICEK